MLIFRAAAKKELDEAVKTKAKPPTDTKDVKSPKKASGKGAANGKTKKVNQPKDTASVSKSKKAKKSKD